MNIQGKTIGVCEPPRQRGRDSDDGSDALLSSRFSSETNKCCKFIAEYVSHIALEWVQN
jgi:hypothetical protein